MSDRLGEIAARLKAATPGPWRRMLRSPDDTTGGLVVLATDGNGVGAAWSDNRPECMGNAALIAHAPEDIAYLVGRVTELEMTNEVLEGRANDYPEAIAQLKRAEQVIHAARQILAKLRAHGGGFNGMLGAELRDLHGALAHYDASPEGT